jgi:hypothetical protein
LDRAVAGCLVAVDILNWRRVDRFLSAHGKINNPFRRRRHVRGAPVYRVAREQAFATSLEAMITRRRDPALYEAVSALVLEQGNGTSNNWTVPDGVSTMPLFDHSHRLGAI